MTVIASYTLTHQCGAARPFCRRCTNSFTVVTCGPTQCDVEPSTVICLEPKLPGGLVEGGCWQFADCGTTLPAAYLVEIAWDAIDPGDRTPGTAGSIAVVAETLSGTENILGTCGLLQSFESSDYPIPEVLSRPSHFVLQVLIGNGFTVSIKYYSGGSIVYTDSFVLSEDWTQLKYPDTELGELCTDANRGGTAAYVPEILFGVPQTDYPIRVKFYPLTEAP